ncbi:MAG: recombination protein RecR [Clostridia bacterium]|nr:recombination protein RecR [Clostridia bacterium]
MSNNIESMNKLINSFSKLPGVGYKTAERYAYSVLKMDRQDVKDFVNNMIEVRNKVHFCENCFNWSEKDVCDICEKRDKQIICVVEEPKDVLSFEKVKDYNGTYHVLHGTISPLNGKGPDDLKIKELLFRVQRDNVKEVIMCTNSNVEGEATSMYVAGLLKPLGVKVSRLAQGISIGSNIEYQDEVTLTKALENRKSI